MGVLRKGLGLRIRQLRREAGLTQEELAKKMEMDYKYLGAVERGEKNITADNIERIVKGLGVEPFELFMFRLKGGSGGERLDDEALANLIKRTERSARPLVVEVVQSILRWQQARKR